MNQDLQDAEALRLSLDGTEYLILTRIVRGVSLKDIAREIAVTPERVQQNRAFDEAKA